MLNVTDLSCIAFAISFHNMHVRIHATIKLNGISRVWVEDADGTDGIVEDRSLHQNMNAKNKSKLNLVLCYGLWLVKAKGLWKEFSVYYLVILEIY